MTIEELRKEKVLLEADLNKHISALLERFTRDTGCSVRGIYLSFVDATQIGDESRRHIFVGGSIDIDTGLEV